MAAGGYRLGVDFGTSNTVAALAGRDGRVRPLLFDGSTLLSSAVFAGARAELLVGGDAVRAAVGSPAGLEANPKRRIDEGTVWLGEREYPVVDLIAAVLDRVRAEAVRVAGQAMDDVVLTHPATWQRRRLGVLAEAADRAGFGPVRFVAEPVAAAAYFTTVLDQRIGSQRCIVVYDLGAGTFDVSVVRPSPGGFEVVASDGLADVGGLDLDAIVVRHARELTGGAREAWQRLDWPQAPADQLARHSLWHAARAVKEQLSRHASGDLHLPLVDRQIHLTREEFEKAARAHLDRTAALTRTVLQTAGVPPEEIAGVFLVGGSSRTPLAATLLHRTLRIAPTIIDQPELVVAEGALHTHAHPAPPSPESAPPTPIVSPPPAVGPIGPRPAARPVGVASVPRPAPPSPSTTPAVAARPHLPAVAASPPGPTPPPVRAAASVAPPEDSAATADTAPATRSARRLFSGGSWLLPPVGLGLILAVGLLSLGLLVGDTNSTVGAGDCVDATEFKKKVDCRSVHAAYDAAAVIARG